MNKLHRGRFQVSRKNDFTIKTGPKNEESWLWSPTIQVVHVEAEGLWASETPHCDRAIYIPFPLESLRFWVRPWTIFREKKFYTPLKLPIIRLGKLISRTAIEAHVVWKLNKALLQWIPVFVTLSTLWNRKVFKKKHFPVKTTELEIDTSCMPIHRDT